MVAEGGNVGVRKGKGRGKDFERRCSGGREFGKVKEELKPSCDQVSLDSSVNEDFLQEGS